MPYIFHDDGAPEADDFDSNWDYVEEDSPNWKWGVVDPDWDKTSDRGGKEAQYAGVGASKHSGYQGYPVHSLWSRLAMLLRH